MRFLQECGFHREKPLFLQNNTQQKKPIRQCWGTNFAELSRQLMKYIMLYLNNVVHNSQIPYIRDLVRIVCSMNNNYRPQPNIMEKNCCQQCFLDLSVLSEDEVRK